MTADSPYSLEALERQWHDDKAPKLGLQLAEEHRRRGDLPAAIDVLETGLEEHPDHLSSRVALSRYLVDSDRFSDALAHLERIVRADPVHLVANKLMVRAFLGLGKLEEARDKLDIYEMLGEGDADIEGLRAQVRGEPAAARLDEPVATVDTQQASASPAPSTYEVAEERVEEAAPVESASESPEPPVEVDGASEQQRPSVEDPDTERDTDMELDVASEAATESVWPPAPPVSRESTQDPTLESAPVPEPPGIEPEPASEVGFELVTERLPHRAEPEPAGEEVAVFLEPPTPEPPPPMFSDDEPFGSIFAQDLSSESWGDAGGEVVFALDEPEPPAEPPSVSESREDEPQAEVVEPGEEGRQSRGATVTLARLYLEQRDSEKAAACFREVLERDPGNEAARVGLESIGADGPEKVSLKERKKAVLIAYRSRIRRAVEGRS